MKKLIMCTGLPGAGKSFWAHQMVLEDFNKYGPKSSKVFSVSKDEIRASLEKDGWVWSREAETKDVLPIRDKAIKNAFANGYETVISEDTNFGFKHEPRLRQIAEECDAEFEIKSFLDVDINLCIERDSKREGKAKVGEKVIRGMAAANMIPSPISIDKVESKLDLYIPDENKKGAIICDLDGTLALNNGHRSVYDYTKVDKDDCNFVIKQILETYYRFMEWNIIYLSGRDDSCRDLTNDWMRKFHCPPGRLLMRTTGDKRKDSIIKYEIFNNFIRNEYFVHFVLDDRNQVVQMWRELGLTCLQVADGNF